MRNKEYIKIAQGRDMLFESVTGALQTLTNLYLFSFRMASVIAFPWCTRTAWLPCSSSVSPKEKTTEG